MDSEEKLIIVFRHGKEVRRLIAHIDGMRIDRKEGVPVDVEALERKEKELVAAVIAAYMEE
jgi:predicted regulator of Ras-like GTPase activity (Roadblock/LC7/MglB family)